MADGLEMLPAALHLLRDGVDVAKRRPNGFSSKIAVEPAAR